jgi:outer membrane cobalamin receptor
MSRHRTASTLAALLCTLTAHRALADGASLEGLLDAPVVSTASKSAESGSKAPATSSILTAEDMRRYGIHSLDEAINFLSLGMMTQNPLHSVEVGSRGVLLTADYGTHVLLLVNGHQMNELWLGAAYFERGAAIPLELIDHVEVILGPGSVLYGSNAMLGVINVITKRAKDYDGAHVVVESELATSLRMAGGYGREFTLGGLSGELTFQAEYYTQSGPAFRFGPQTVGDDPVTGTPKRFSRTGPGTGVWGGVADRDYYTRIPAFYARAMLGDFEIDLRAASYKRGTPYTNQVNLTVGDFNDPNSYETDRWLSADIRHHVSVSSLVDIKSRLYGDIYDYEQPLVISAPADCLGGAPNGCTRRVYGATKWGGAELQGIFDWARDGQYVGMIGFDGRMRHVEQSTGYRDALTNEDLGAVGVATRNQGVLGLYAQQTASPTASLAFNAGIRFDSYPDVGSAFSPRFATTYSPWAGGTLRGIYAQAFRAPSIYEQTYADPSAQIPPAAIKPERVQSLEASIEQRFGSQRIFFNLFRSWWRNLISFQDLTPDQIAQAIAAGQLEPSVTYATRYQNLDTIDNYGWSGAFEGSQLDTKLRYGLNVTGAYARRSFPETPSHPLAVAPSLFGNARISYTFGGSLPTAALATYFFNKSPADRAFDGGFTPTPYAPIQVGIRATLSGPSPILKGLSYRVSAHSNTAASTPYVAGPNQAATDTQTAAQLAPVDRFRTTVGFQYDMPM